MTVLLVDLDGALGDTRPLWHDWLRQAGRVLNVDPETLPADRGAAAAALDAHGAGNWRSLLERFAHDRMPVYIRPSAEASTALRHLAASDVRVGVFTDAPEELARAALAYLGAARRVDAVEAGTGALDRLRARLGDDGSVVRTRDDLVGAAL
jgi:phosphoglycolate phosphatase-like HAD superfamily hydrolase